MGSSPLSEAARSIRDWSTTEGRASSKPANAADIFGTRVFSDKVQQERLPKPAYRALRATITRGETLNPNLHSRPRTNIAQPVNPPGKSFGLANFKHGSL